MKSIFITTFAWWVLLISAAIAEEVSLLQGTFIAELDIGQHSKTLLESLRADGFSVEHRMDLKSTLFNGVSFTIGDSEDSDTITSKVLGKFNVRSVWPVRRITMPKLNPASSGGDNGTVFIQTRSLPTNTTQKASQSYPPHVLAQIDKVREIGYTGKGIRIGVVDTGVDYRHPALGGCFGDGCIVSYGWDFAGDSWGGYTPPVPDDDPLDTCQGHGTHVTGIIVAQENDLGFTGVAPDVSIGAYKVSGCPGYTTSEVLVAAFLKAYEEGSDIITCSAGDESGWSTDAAAVAVSRIAEAGTPVLVAAGNSGNLGLWRPASPSSGKEVAGIGSADNIVIPTLMTRGIYSNDTGAFSFGYFAQYPVIESEAQLPLWAPRNATCTTDYGCSPLPDDTPDLSDRIILLHTPIKCFHSDQAANLAAKGAKFIIYYPQTLEDTKAVPIYNVPLKHVGIVTPHQALEWLTTLRAGKKIDITLIPANDAGRWVEDFPRGLGAGLPSSFTSWGPSWEGELKPQFIAPGGNILSTWTWASGDYMVNSGTSMSTPFMAGVYALVSQARNIKDAQTIRSVISSTAQPLKWFDLTTEHDILAPVPQQGGGLVQALRAVQATTLFSRNGFTFNDTDHFVKKHHFTIDNKGDKEVSYSLGHAKAATTYLFVPGVPYLQYSRSPPATAEAWATITFNSDSIIIPPGDSAEVQFTVHPPRGLNTTLLPVYSGFITIEGSNEQSFSIPYLGVGGSMHETPIFDRTGLAPFLGVYLSSTANHFLIPVNPDQTFTIPAPGTSGNAIFPKLVILPSVGSQSIHVNVVALEDGSTRVVGQLPQTPLSYVALDGWTWDFTGQLANGSYVGAGTYAFDVRGLKIFGNPDDDADWDTVSSVSFILKYL